MYNHLKVSVRWKTIFRGENIVTRQEACYYLQISEDATEDEVKKAYRVMAKRFHPDVNPDIDTKEYYIKIQEAYEYLEIHPYQMKALPTNNQPRPAKIFSTNATVKTQFQRQKQNEKEYKRIKLQEEEKRKKLKESVYTENDFGLKNKADNNKKVDNSQSKEEEILEKIRAIWLAETIRRQIEVDKERKEAQNRQKLYRAFMQQRIHEDESKNHS